MSPQKSEVTRWFAKEVQPHEPVLRAYLRRFAEWRDIDDLVQETYARLLRVKESDRLRSPRGLLFTTARNAARDLFRRRAVERSSSIEEIDYDDFVDETSIPSDTAVRSQEIELLHAAIRALPERCRVVLLMRRFENLSHREIASRLGIAQHTVEAHLTKALHRCEAFLKANAERPQV